ncbi:MAG: hypothetical protein SFX18_08930 [Pirellulales bacterium]|nr:hypothetical protein [Pirellulales bacterium]
MLQISGRTSITLSDVENALLTGGSSQNSFTVSGWTGMGMINGGGSEIDTIIASKNRNFTLADNMLSASDGMMLNLANIDYASLTGGSSQNSFTVSGWTGRGEIHGAGPEKDTIIAEKDLSFTLTNTQLTSTDGMILALSSIENANLKGGASPNSFGVSEWTGMGSLDGNGTTEVDTVIAEKNADFILTNSNLSTTDGMMMSLIKITGAVLIGGAADNTFNLNGWTGIATIDGKGMTDKLIGNNLHNNWTIDGSDQGNIDNRVFFTSIGNLDGGFQNQVVNSVLGAKAGTINNNESSTLEITQTVGDGNVSFDRVVSSEFNFDFLRFFINGVQQAAWSGNVPLSNVTFPVSAGTHTFRWTYSKDATDSFGDDTAWIDNVIFPAVPHDISDNFETGGFNTLPWTTFGNSNWNVKAGDQFIFTPAGSVSGSIDGQGGADAVNFSQLASQDVTLLALGAIDGFNGFTLPNTTIAGLFNNIDGIIGSASATNDRLTGLNTNSTWTHHGIGGDYEDNNSGTILSYSQFEILNGGSDVDQFDILKVTGNPLFANGNTGADLFNVGSTLANNDGNLDRIKQPLTISGGDGDDQLYINDFANRDPAGNLVRSNFLVTANTVIDLPPAILTKPEFATPPRTLFAGINYDGTTETLSLDTNDAPNFVSAIPSVDTTYKLNAHDPKFGDLTGMDCLVVDFTGVIGQKFSYTGIDDNSGKWTFKNRKPIEFKNFECFNFGGNVDIEQKHGLLYLTGDNAHNGISLSRGPNGTVSVVGLGTKLNNGNANPLFFTGVTGVIAKFHDGDDFLHFNKIDLEEVLYFGGNDNDQLQVGSGQFPDITTMAGVNTAILAGSVGLSKTIHFDGGKGADCADFIRTFGDAIWDFNLGDGDDMITTYWSSSGAISAVTDSGNDTINFGYHTAQREVTFDGVKGNDFINIFISSFQGEAVFFGGSGTDTIAIDTNNFAKSVLIDTGADHDFFLFAANVVGHHLTIVTGHGYDSGFLGRHIDGSSGGNIAKKLVLDGGSETDKIRIGNNAFEDFFAVLGSGDDEVTIDDYLYVKNRGTLDGGSGKNKLTKIGTPNLKFISI